jgi:hypothetical protein
MDDFNFIRRRPLRAFNEQEEISRIPRFSHKLICTTYAPKSDRKANGNKSIEPMKSRANEFLPPSYSPKNRPKIMPVNKLQRSADLRIGSRPNRNLPIRNLELRTIFQVRISAQMIRHVGEAGNDLIPRFQFANADVSVAFHANCVRYF